MARSAALGLVDGAVVDDAPSRSSIVRYGVCRTRSRSCVAMTTTVPPALMSRSSWKTPRVARSSRLPVGSSASRMAGSLTSARAIATRCCSPPDSSRGIGAALGREADLGEHPHHPRRDRVAAGRRSPPARTRRSLPRCGLPAAGSPGTRCRAGGGASAPRPRLSAATLKPETRTSPLVGCCSAKRSFRMVDLPAPECPVRKTNSPLPTWKETSFRAKRAVRDRSCRRGRGGSRTQDKSSEAAAATSPTPAPGPR